MRAPKFAQPKVRILLAAAISLLTFAPCPLFAQAQRSDAGGDAQDARTDAMFAMPSLSGTEPLSNLYATAPGLEEQIPSADLRLNGILPLGWDSNPTEVSSGGPTSWQTNPLGNASIAGPIGGLFRFTATGFGTLNRYFSASDADNDRLGGSARLQYVDPNNDQAFSPYVAFAPRWEYATTFSALQEARQDFNLGFNQRFNFDGSFQRIPIAADTSAETVWSFGVTVFGQERERQQRLSSQAVFVIPSVSYVISKDWSASLAVELLGRWYERDRAGEASRDWEALPIGTLEYAIPASFFGGDEMAKKLGRPALDFQGSYLKVWSTVPGVSFGQWEALAAIRMGWRF